MDIQGIYRRFTGLKDGKGSIDLRLTQQESMAVGQVEPANFEMTRAGRRFFLGWSAGVTGIAPVQAIPTTSAQWMLWNPDAVKSYFFEEVSMILTSGTPGLGGSLWAAIVTAPALSGANSTGLTAQNSSNGGPSSKAICKSSPASLTTPAAPVWFQLDESRSAITAAAFSTGYANGFARRDLAGALALPPLSGLALAVVAPTGTTPLYAPQARWVEQEADME